MIWRIAIVYAIAKNTNISEQGIVWLSIICFITWFIDL